MVDPTIRVPKKGIMAQRCINYYSIILIVLNSFQTIKCRVLQNKKKKYQAIRVTVQEEKKEITDES